MNTQTTKIALVTGATRGIGLETVRQLASAGVHTLLAGRNYETAVARALELQAEGLPVEALRLDVDDTDSIAVAFEHVQQRHGRLDILVNNAGVLVDDLQAGASGQSLDTWRSTFNTNLFAVVELTTTLLPLLRNAPAARIVNVSSNLASLTLHAQPGSEVYGFLVPAYNASKSALNAWTVQLAHELREGPIKVNAVHPGYVKTDMNGGQGEVDVAEGSRSSVAMALIGFDGPNGSFSHLGESLPW